MDPKHSYDPSVISFFALEVIPQNSRGGDFDKKILQEAKLIYNQKVTLPPELYTAFTFKPFL